MSGIWALVPCKRFACAKRRLAGLLAPTERAALALAMLEDVLAALGRVQGLAGVVVITAEPAAAARAAKLGARVVTEPAPAGLNPALGQGAALAVAEGATALVVMAGDLPLATPDEIARLLASLGPAPSIALAPDRHGHGTNALALRPPGIVPFRFGPASRARHRRAALAAGCAIAEIEAPGLALDLDTPDDLLLARVQGGLGRTGQLLDAIGIGGRTARQREEVAG